MIHEVPNTRVFLEEIYTLLKPEGCFFVAEPKFHVPHDDFERTLREAQGMGFTVSEGPSVRFSWAAVLAR
jgi:2-polyprenyl-3-methyl-5-hydroxy-6-metoxy-1,4-benzoquinol methylase